MILAINYEYANQTGTKPSKAASTRVVWPRRALGCQIELS